MITFLRLFILIFASCISSNLDSEDQNTPPILVASMTNLVVETSGLGKYENNYLTHNDKGNENEIFIISNSGSIVREVNIENAINTDWEDLAQSETHLYISDTSIGFTIPVSSGLIKNDFDCEALIYQNDFFYIFSKNRLDRKSHLYRIPVQPGQYVAEYISSFNSQGLITGADISDDGSTVVLIGYNKDGASFLWKLTEFTGDDFFSGKKSRTILGAFSEIGQTEAVIFEDISTLQRGQKTQMLNFTGLRIFKWSNNLA